MSRIGKNPIEIPAGVDVTINGADVTVKGPKGTLSHVVPEPISAAIDEGKVVVTRPSDDRVARSLHGLTRTLIANMIEGVTKGFSKQLEIAGTGYRVVAKGKDLEFSLGFSHTITVTRRHRVLRRISDEVHRVGHRQAARWRDRRSHP